MGVIPNTNPDKSSLIFRKLMENQLRFSINHLKYKHKEEVTLSLAIYKRRETIIKTSGLRIFDKEAK